MVVVVMVTGQDLPHFLIAPDDSEEAAPIRTPQKVIWVTEEGSAVSGGSVGTETGLKPE